MASARLTLRLTRTSPTHHDLVVVRGDGSQESLHLETRSCLRHDLVHFAVETEAGLRESFFGMLARGVRYEELARIDMTQGQSEIAATEQVVGALQGALAKGRTPAEFVAGLTGMLATMAARPPAWLTVPLVERVYERMRRLEGQWRATPFGSAMELWFPG